jgi:hypothetical protein
MCCAVQVSKTGAKMTKTERFIAILAGIICLLGGALMSVTAYPKSLIDSGVLAFFSGWVERDAGLGGLLFWLGGINLCLAYFAKPLSARGASKTKV